MTDEQYKRAVQIHARLNELQEVKKEIEGTRGYRLWYAEKDNRDWKLTSECAMINISELLDKHDAMIRAEIEEEIFNLLSEIERL